MKWNWLKKKRGKSIIKKKKKNEEKEIMSNKKNKIKNIFEKQCLKIMESKNTFFKNEELKKIEIWKNFKKMKYRGKSK